MKSFIFKVLLIPTLALLMNGVTAGNVSGSVRVVNCTGLSTGGPLGMGPDRDMIQTAINNAKCGDTVKLQGICQLDGTLIRITKSNLTITGAGSPTWSSVVRGIANANGNPVGILPSGQWFNIAFAVGDSNGTSQVSNLRIQNLKFSTLHGVADVAPQLGGEGRTCSGPFSEFIGTGSLENFSFQNNWLDNNADGVFIVGNSNNLLIKNNKISNNRGSSIVVQGQGFICLDAGTGQFLPLFPFGIPTNVAITGNSISQDKSSFPIFIAGSNKIRVNNNEIATNPVFALAALVIGESSNSLITNNKINATGTFLGGIYASDWGAATPGFPPNSSKNLITNNTISNAPAGDVVDTSTTGYSIVAEKISGTTVADIYLCGAVTDPSNFICEGQGNPTGPSIPSFNNHVVALPATTVRDDGTNNKIIGGIILNP